MNLQGRNLTPGARGADVKLLQSELRQLTLPIPEEEFGSSVYGTGTQEAVRAFQRTNQLPITGVVDQPTATAINAKLDEQRRNLIVRGQVLSVDGRPQAQLRVTAVDRDLRSEEQLGQAATDRNGAYEIRYEAGQFRRAEKAQADLVVRAFSAAGEVLAQSPIRFNAQPVEVINLIVGGTVVKGPSEYDRLAAELAPLLIDIPAADLREDKEHQDITFLSGETGIASSLITFYVVAHRVSRDTRVEPRAFYALFRQQLPTNLSGLLALAPDRWREGLEAADNANIVEPWRAGGVAQIVQSLSELAARRTLEQPAGTKGSTVGPAVASVLDSEPLRVGFASRLASHEGPIEEFWSQLSADPQFRDRVAPIQVALQLTAVAQNHLPMLNALQQRQINNPAQLASFDVADWQQLIDSTVAGVRVGFPADIPGANAQQKALNYAKAMANIVEDVFPSAVVANRLSRENRPAGQGVVTFLNRNQAFNIRYTPVDHYIATHPDAFAGVEDREPVTRQLRAMQRVYHVAPRYAAMRALLDAGFDSAHAITRQSKNVFLQRNAKALGGTAQAKRVYEKASQTTASAWALLTDYGQAFQKTPLQVLPKRAPSVPGMPDLETLFGSLDLCACQHCRSVYGPAAYYVDILAFLKDRPSKTAGTSAKAVLFDRRPDLGLIELSCINTNTPLPYIDLVNELLENAVSPATAVPDAQRQTHRTAAELKTGPEYVNAGAYNTLALEVFPWKLPFQLWIEEGRAYLDHLGVQRHELMTVFQRAGNPADAQIAAERLRLIPDEATIVGGGTLASPRQPWEFWGRPAGSPGTWIADHAKVRKFLDASGLAYSDLAELLKLRLINPDGALKIESGDPEDPHTCDTNKLVIAGLTAAHLDRIHRFVRLWRKLGWTMRDLDIALQALQTGGITPDAITMLGAIEALRKTLKQKTPVVLSWFSRLDTARYEEDESEPNDPKSQYETIFQNPAILQLHTGQPDLFALNAARTELQTVGSLTDSKVAAVLLAVLRTTDVDLAALVSGPDAVVAAGQEQNLENLSRLYRHATLARALKLKVRELLQIKALTGRDPFVDLGAPVTPAHLKAAAEFVEMVDAIRDSGFRVRDLDYLLRHQVVPPALEQPSDTALAAVLEEIRTGLRKIADENTFSADTSDPTGEQTGKKLALIQIEPAIVEQVVATFSDSIVYTAPLAALPGGTVFPTPLDSRTAYDATSGVLGYRGVMTVADRATLDGLSADASYQSAVTSLFVQPRTLVGRHLKTFEQRTWSTPLAAMPAGAAFPDALARKIHHEPEAGELRFTGVMTDVERAALEALSSDATYRAALTALFNAPGTFIPSAEQAFFTAADATTLFDAAATPEKRFNTVLAKLMTYLRSTMSASLVKQALGERLKVESSTIDGLVTRWVHSPLRPALTALDEFVATSFVGSSPALKVSPVLFPELFATYRLLSKISAIYAGFGMDVRATAWLFEFGPTVGWLDLQSLPLTPTASGAALFDAWARVNDLFRLRNRIPAGTDTLDALLRRSRDPAATLPDFLDSLAKATDWSLSDLTFLTGASGFALSWPGDFQDERALIRLLKCMDVIARLGVSAEQCVAWSKPVLTTDDARAIQQAAKSKHDSEQWLTIAPPLREPLREQQRDALVAYLVVRPNAAANQQWTDTNGLYAYFLIDVEMNACQMTSRIKQAISTVQLFAQRCLMNLEPRVAATLDVDSRWREWKWMKNYRIWEANRKIFLYPENWLEPELRDNKSPFFKELEQQLLQGEVTDDSAETAFRTYLEKLEVVSRLDIVGMYHQVEKDQQGNVAVDVLHVFGRTRSTPHVYYYRQRVDAAYWTAWEKVNIDIESDHVIPVIWNRRLHVFWPVFTELAEDQSITMPSTGQSLGDPPRFWRLQMAWTEYKNGKWLARKISRDFLDEPWLRPQESLSFHLLATSPDLRIGVFIRQSFEVDLVSIGNYYFQWNWAEFRSRGCEVFLEETTDVYDINAISVPGSYFDFMTMRQDLGQGANLKLHYGSFPYTSNIDALKGARKTVSTLATTPTSYRLLTAHQDVQFASQRPFFYQDATRTFFVLPEDVRAPRRWDPGIFDPGVIDIYPPRYWEEFNPIPDPIGPVINPADPVIFEVTSPVEQTLPQTALLTQFSRRDMEVTPPASRLTAGTFLTGTLSAATPLATRSAAVSAPVLRSQALAGSLTPMSTRLGTLSFRGAVTTRSTKILTEAQASNVLQDIGAHGAYTLWPHRHEKRYTFQPFYHPYVCLFVSELNRHGVDGLLQRRLQTTPHAFQTPSTPFSFSTKYKPTYVVRQPHPVEDVDFTYAGAYALYNWELFCHVPLLIAQRLGMNQRFEEAQRWYHYIFDPTDTSANPSPQRYWRMRRFFETSDEEYQNEQIQRLLQLLAEGSSDPELVNQVKEWRKHPFKPHVVARLRTTAYQKNIVMKYLDNLIAWGDQLFRRDTIESINEATQLYILASDILGRRPEKVPSRGVPAVQNYNQIEPKLDDFSNALVQAEQLVAEDDGPVVSDEEPPVTIPPMLYFCVPPNDKLLGYWDTVADRLFKIRNCMNIEGVVRQLPLFEPPIDPGMLVKAAAAGVDLTSILSDISAPPPYYRFAVLAQKATELASEVRFIGNELLSVLEKRDAESLALLRSTHEIRVLDAVTTVREQQIDEAKQTLESLKRARDLAKIRHAYYSSLQFTNAAEAAHISALKESVTFQNIGAYTNLVAQALAIIPNIKIGAPTSMGATFGGDNLAAMIKAFVSHMCALGGIASTEAQLSAANASYQRRSEEWKLQTQLAAKEIEQAERQIVAGEIRVAIAERELSNHELQIENAQEIDAYMRDKFTSQELYDWMVGQIATVYFQSYQLAYDAAKRAERAYRYELGLEDSTFVQFGYWDSLKKGLHAGERLFHDIKRLESSYLDQNRREYEITKHISFAQVDPMALVKLRDTGSCIVDLPEALFDRDYPGQYMRRIKSARLTIPCVTGPYTGINCTVTLLRNTVRKSTSLAGGYLRTDEDLRFRDSLGVIQSIATSHAQNDGGLFELSFRDERYLPFEGAGAISQWRIELPKATNRFDLDTISDVVVHVLYTAREGGEPFRAAAVEAVLETSPQTGTRLFSARHDFAADWQRFLHPEPAADVQALTATLTPDRFPFEFRLQPIQIDRISIFLKLRDGVVYPGSGSPLSLFLRAPEAASDHTAPLQSVESFLNGTPHAIVDVSADGQGFGEWRVEARGGNISGLATALRETVTIEGVPHHHLKADAIDDILMLCHFSTV